MKSEMVGRLHTCKKRMVLSYQWRESWYASIGAFNGYGTRLAIVCGEHPSEVGVSSATAARMINQYRIAEIRP